MGCALELERKYKDKMGEGGREGGREGVCQWEV